MDRHDANVRRHVRVHSLNYTGGLVGCREVEATLPSPLLAVLLALLYLRLVSLLLLLLAPRPSLLLYSTRSLPSLLSPVLSLTLSSRDVYQPSLQTYRISTPRFPNWRVDKLVLQPSWVPVAGCSRMHCLHR